MCISSQVGCTLACTFCHTGTQKLVRNLTAGEIVGQFMIGRDSYGEWPSPKEGRMLSNVVMMGMGEPLFNTDNVIKALTIIMDGDGLSVSRRRITLSTSGVVPEIGRVGRELGVGLAISLHAVTDELRDVLVPINRKYPIEELLRACRDYPAASNARRITFEYVMLDGVNDSLAEAREMARLLKDIPAKINLIPFNKWPGAIYGCTPAPRIRKFSETLNDLGLSAPIRVPRGRDILAACGQLKSESVPGPQGEGRGCRASRLTQVSLLPIFKLRKWNRRSRRETPRIRHGGAVVCPVFSEMGSGGGSRGGHLDILCCDRLVSPECHRRG